jgi:hypothetical protein
VKRQNLQAVATPAFASIVVVVFDMEREGKRALLSLSAEYQRDVTESEYEVIVVENGSRRPIGPEFVGNLGSNFTYHSLPDAPPSPAFAINYGRRQARGDLVGVIIDGARICTPGIVKYALAAARMFANPVIATLGWHLGPSRQNLSIAEGYDQQVEDELLARIAWPEDGYRLFEIASLAGSSRDGWFVRIAESNCLFMRAETFDEIGGYDERFDLPGGGLVNLDVYSQLCGRADTNLVMLLGEGTFHQLHGGVMTNVPHAENRIRWHEFERQYSEIRKKPYELPSKLCDYVGSIPPQALPSIRDSAETALRILRGRAQ